jgi:hypothetical protein
MADELTGSREEFRGFRSFVCDNLKHKLRTTLCSSMRMYGKLGFAVVQLLNRRYKQRLQWSLYNKNALPITATIVPMIERQLVMKSFNDVVEQRALIPEKKMYRGSAQLKLHLPA